ncbi:MAG: Coenzyme F420 hydrogenase/dehydrogenase, beta subunit C-terminal domain [Desulfatitalea sp.]
MRRSNNDDAPPCFERIGPDLCTGCAACANGCSRDAIEIRLDPQGFYRPRRIKDLCSDCMACIGYCPVIAAEKRGGDAALTESPEVFAAWSTDEQIHAASSSGGIFSELARHILDQSGRVCGCAWGEEWTPQHVIVREWAQVAPLRGSKYVPSFVGPRLYREIITLAESGTPVLFSGTPCQVAGLERIASPGARANLLLVDVVCHGVPSLISFWRYLEWRFGARKHLTHFTFRNKEISTQTICAKTHTGAKYMATCAEDPWFRSAMVYHLLLQRCCFECRFGALPRSGDITLGDFWGIPAQWHHPRGDSVVLANTEKGKQFLRGLTQGGRIRVKPSNFGTASAKVHRLRGSIYPLPALRNLALQWIADGKSFGRVYRLCYLPFRLKERFIAAARRKTRGLSRPLRHLWSWGR